jgi:hypothetical protein
MQARFLKPVFWKKIFFAISIAFGIGFPGSIFAPGLTQAQERAIAASKREQACQGSLIWFEARGEPIQAQRGVLDVAQNRAAASGLSVCDVLVQPGQFQWTKHHDPTGVDEQKLALLHSVQRKPKFLGVEKFFFSLPSPPKWAHNMKCRLIGHTTFCREAR